MEDSAKKLELISHKTGRILLTLPIRGKARDIAYITHPNNKKKTKIDERPLSLPELLRMPAPLLKSLMESLNDEERTNLSKIIRNARKARTLNEVCFRRFISCTAKVA